MPFDDPGWTPLFLNAAALVTETGGMISHGATTRIQDGRLITVDGSRGTISLGAQGR
ncbi:PEP-utilizing enzyme [Nonomuraea endophytica]|uniref:Phosphohistidine swiveling domain-containing protein n=1 Tax=Nonomuraea endophytica TaxID=714136 RepID=A0A7W8EKG7_9ACTN|nr:PEP-utilizing enzyme [Nonomuraea endophytica]MBB5081792.1 phosphohistidine swiveling domain-containing protein [Nonomuraea endophytica]